MSNRLSAYKAMQSDWHRWEMQDLDESKALTPEATIEPIPTPEELAAQAKAQLEQAQADGHHEGYQLGQQQGYQSGYDKGQAEGYAAGQSAGYQAGMDDAQAQLASHKALFEQLTLRCSESIGELNESMGQALIRLAIDIAEHVLADTITLRPESILGIVHQVLHQDPTDQSLLTLVLHPDDLDIVKQYLQEQVDTRPWRLQADAQLQRGDCIARSAYGDIDATLRTRWRRSIGALAQTPPIQNSTCSSGSSSLSHG